MTTVSIILLAAACAILALAYYRSSTRLASELRRSSQLERSAVRAAELEGVLTETHSTVAILSCDGAARPIGGDADPRAVAALRGLAASAFPPGPEARTHFVSADGQRFRVTIARHLESTHGAAALAIVQPDLIRDPEPETLSRLASRNEAILRTSIDGFFVVGEDYRFLEVNQAFARMTGYSAAELLQMTILDLEIDEPQRSQHGAEYVVTGLHQFAAAHRHKDGHFIHLELSVNVVRDSGRKLVVGFARDVTERRRAEDSLLRVTRQKKQILHSATEGIVGLDASGEVTFCNPAAARLLGRSVGEIVGTHAHAVFCASAGTSCTGCDLLLRGGIPKPTERTMVRADQAVIPVELTSAPMHENSRVVGAVVVFSDISARKRAEEDRRVMEAQIQQAQKLESLGLLAGGIAHDFNNILVGILGNACIAMEDLPSASPALPRLQRIVNAGQRASRVIHQILAYAGQARPDLAPIDLSHAVTETAEFMRPSVPQQIDLELCLTADLPAVHADAGQLEQILTNLLLNAVEAIGGSEGAVTLATRRADVNADRASFEFAGQELRPGSYGCLEVSDTGCGMSPETLARIFDPFFSGKKKGRGLGLAAIRGIVRAHGGAIAVHSVVGRGTTFEILLPLAAEPAAKTESSSAKRLSLDGRRRTVLVIDDEEDICDVVATLLGPRGIHVLTATSGTAGIELFKRNADQIDLVLLDVTMPGITGPETLRAIRAIRDDARIVFSSGYNGDGIESALAGHGAVGFLHKPYTPETLLERIDSAMQVAV
jgi:two-component system cell cycle sensor histidine kinase/response regulator CckA